MGIKKYEEDFTKEHYEEIKKLQTEAKLSNQSEDFLRLYEQDVLIMIMNTVAYQNYIGKGVPVDQGKIVAELVAKILKRKFAK